MGYESKFVENGIQLGKVVKDFKPDVIILDLIMPEKDGFQTLVDLKSDDETKNACDGANGSSLRV